MSEDGAVTRVTGAHWSVHWKDKDQGFYTDHNNSNFRREVLCSVCDVSLLLWHLSTSGSAGVELKLRDLLKRIPQASPSPVKMRGPELRSFL